MNSKNNETGSFGSALQEIRNRSGLGLRPFARKLHIPHSTLKQLESGQRNPPKRPASVSKFYESLSKAPGVTAEDISWLKSLAVETNFPNPALQDNIRNMLFPDEGIMVSVDQNRLQLTESELRILRQEIIRSARGILERREAQS